VWKLTLTEDDVMDVAFL